MRIKILIIVITFFLAVIIYELGALLIIKRVINHPLDIYYKLNNKSISVDSTRVMSDGASYNHKDKLFIVTHAYNNLRKEIKIDSVYLLDISKELSKRVNVWVNQSGGEPIPGRSTFFIDFFLDPEDIIKFKDSFINNTLSESIYTTEGIIQIHRHIYLNESVPIVLERYPPYYKNRIQIRKDSLKDSDMLYLSCDSLLSWSVYVRDNVLFSREYPSLKIDTIFKDAFKTILDEEGKWTNYYYEAHIPISIMGPYLSYMYHHESSVSYTNNYSTIDLRSKRDVSLVELFPKENIKNALLKVPMIIASLKNKAIDVDTLTFEEAINILDDCDPFYYDILYHYRFSRTIKDSIEIEFGLPNNYFSSESGHIKKFLIKLNVPDSLSLYSRNIQHYKVPA